MKVVFCCPTIERPHQALVDALRNEALLIEEAGFEHEMTVEIGNPYISHARAAMLRRALTAAADIIVFLDHDMSWKAGELLRLIQTRGDAVAGLYRFKSEPEKYMGAVTKGPDGQVIVREDGCIKADWVPAGFLKITKEGVDRFMRAYPELCFGARFALFVDLFNHGAADGVWWGEDYAFSRRWNAMGEDLWIVPDLEITHHTATEAFPGNYGAWLQRQPGGHLHVASDTTAAPRLSAA